MDRQDRETRRAENQVWNGWGDYARKPELLTFDRAGDAELYGNTVLGLACRYYDFDRFRPLLNEFHRSAQEALYTDIFFLVLEGAVRVYRANLEGREQTVIYLRPGEALNLPAAFASDRSAAASAQAVGNVTLLRLGLQELRQLVLQRPAIGLALMRSANHVEITPARWTTGPSRPDDPPVPSVISEAAAEASPSRVSTRPPSSAAPSITSATVRTRPSGVKRSRISPTASPPSVGTAISHHHGRMPASLVKVWSSIP